MVSAEVKITNKLGLHARPATKLVRTAASGKSEVFLEKNGQRINAQSILGVMLLQAEQGSTLKIEVVGEDEQDILNSLVELIRSKFGEE
ncbi:MAG TPA: HPr family phosphocarrier protein [Bacteroidetes bacterium]|nr:HPr family phosphocarrier protein [Bacteroidota bacterium]